MPIIRKKKKEQKKNLKEKVSNILELPKEIMLNIPKITILGCQNLLIENYKSVIEYENCRIKINTNIGEIKIIGTKMSIRGITAEEVIIEGDINSFEYVKQGRG